jgi:protein-disulfide isomerase
MRYFWHFFIAIVTLGGIVLLFFAFSLRVKNNITFTDDAVTQPTITIADPILGPADAPVTIVNFGDYQCEGCRELEQTLANLVVAFPGKIRIVWKDMPNESKHPEAITAAIAARCAGEQDKFWEYHDLLFANQSLIGAELYTTISTELGLRDRAFAKCLEDKTTAPLVQKTYDEGIALQLTATPTIFLNGERYTGAVDETTLKAIIRPLAK